MKKILRPLALRPLALRPLALLTLALRPLALLTLPVRPLAVLPLAVVFALCLFASARHASAQVAPTATTSNAVLDYDLRYTQILTFNQSTGGQGLVDRSAASGEILYSNGEDRHPFSVAYAGGEVWAIQGAGTGTGFFQHLLISQGFASRDWSMNISDDVSYTPVTPTLGFSGIPGLGGLPTQPTPVPQATVVINAPSLYNALDGNFERRMTYNTTGSVLANYDILRFPDGNGLEVTQFQVSPKVSLRLDARNRANAQYSFNRFTYPGLSGFHFDTQRVLVGYSYQWSRRLSAFAAVGPEFISSSDAVLIPQSTGVAAQAAVIYNARVNSLSINYFRAAIGGTGFATQVGSENDNVNGVYTRILGRDYELSASGTYNRTQGFTAANATNTAVGEIQGTRQWGRYVNVFASYSVIDQNSAGALASNAYSGVSNMIAFGIGYHPRETRLIRK